MTCPRDEQSQPARCRETPPQAYPSVPTRLAHAPAERPGEGRQLSRERAPSVAPRRTPRWREASQRWRRRRARRAKSRGASACRSTA
eukprot:scaffold4963_cov97-Isochrysis_galbana.AAC.3